jgi:hypothetical protein
MYVMIHVSTLGMPAAMRAFFVPDQDSIEPGMEPLWTLYVSIFATPIALYRAKR